MEKIDELKQRIADILKVNVASIDNGFPLNQGRLKTSAGTLILSNAIKKIYGKSVNCKNVSSFGELMSRINGEEVAADLASKTNVDSPCSATKLVATNNSGLPVCGIDIQEIDVFPESDDYWKEDFYTDNFTKDEIAYCVLADSPRHSFAARWCVKEALHKCGAVYYNIPLIDIQVAQNKDGLLRVELREGDNWTVLPLSCSLSHAENYAVGMVTGVVGR